MYISLCNGILIRSMTTRATKLGVDFSCRVLGLVAPAREGEQSSGIGVDFNQTGSWRLIGASLSKHKKEQRENSFSRRGIHCLAGGRYTCRPPRCYISRFRQQITNRKKSVTDHPLAKPLMLSPCPPPRTFVAISSSADFWSPSLWDMGDAPCNCCFLSILDY